MRLLKAKKFLAVTVALFILFSLSSITLAATKVSGYGTKLGDINGDGKLTIEDCELFEELLEEKSGNNVVFTSGFIKIADLNTDGKVDSTDKHILSEHIMCVQYGTDLKWGNAYYIGAAYYAKLPLVAKVGDINQNGVINDTDVEMLDLVLRCSEMGNYVVDINKNGEIDLDDYMQTEIVKESIWDINEDGKISNMDYSMLKNHNMESIQNSIEKNLVDLNSDSKIDNTDLFILERHVLWEKELAEWKLDNTVAIINDKISIEDAPVFENDRYKELPIKPGIGDFDRDGIVHINDIMTLKVCLATGDYSSVDVSLADANEDGLINDRDVEILAKHFDKVKGYETLPIDERQFFKVGDVNQDKVVDFDDVGMLKIYIEKAPESDLVKYLADTNGDGKITAKDYDTLQKHLKGTKGYETLPVIEIGAGDIDKDGRVTTTDMSILRQAILNGDMSNIDKTLADVNEDGFINERDIEIMNNYILKVAGYGSLPIDERQFFKVGDVNQDGRVNASDYMKIRQYVSGTSKEIVTCLADTNADGKITAKDYEILKKHIAKEDGYKTLPIKEESEEKEVLLGDVDGNGKLGTTDYVKLNGYVRGVYSDINTAVADLNDDGLIDERDVKILKERVINRGK